MPHSLLRASKRKTGGQPFYCPSNLQEKEIYDTMMIDGMRFFSKIKPAQPSVKKYESIEIIIPFWKMEDK